MRLSACAKTYRLHATTEVFAGGGELEGTVDVQNNNGQSNVDVRHVVFIMPCTTYSGRMSE